MSKQLFNEFSEVSTKQWKQKIQYDLKGADYNETLIWKTNEGIDVKPFYHLSECTNNILHVNTKATQWQICQTIFVANTEKSNTKALDLLQRGAESLKFIIPSPTISFSELTKGIDLSITPVILELHFLDDTYIKQLSILPSSYKISVQNDIISHLASSGNWYHNIELDHEYFTNNVLQSSSISVNVGLYQNAGANMVQQLAYALAHVSEYLNHFNTLSSKEKHLINVTFNVAVGSNYFFEIAKLRALRILWIALANEFDFNSECQINVTPTKRNKTLYDYNTNMLRTTTECMSAILGGANTISNLAYDAIYHKDNEFGERISRNQLLILKHESYFDKVDNPADGTYYIETLTHQLSEKALELFKDIEANGGFLHQLKEGIIQRKIKESASKEQEQFNTGEIVLLGTNKHPNVNDKMKDELELYPFIKTNPVKTLIEPIIERRLAELLEQKRLQDE